MNKPIAVIGLGCCYPDAPTPNALWENTLAQRRAFRRLPAERLSLADYWSKDRGAADSVYAANAAVIEGYEFDRARFRVGGAAFRSADLAHWLALDVAAQTLADAGSPDGEDLPRQATGVFLGNTLTGEFSRANLMRLRWPYVRRVAAATLGAEGWDETHTAEYLAKLETVYKEPFAPMMEDSLAGGLSNTIAGRICNFFDFQGCGFTLDGACSSSLLALAQACAALQAGDVDAALAGGVDLSLDPFELVGFSRTNALAAEMMRVYEARSQGFWPGEGCGFALLMRHDEALAQGRRIYAVVRGWGMSSDGSGGITRPSVAGQLLALERAYRRAGYGVETVTYFEGHGTGTSVGDATELRTLTTARANALAQHNGHAKDFPPAFVGSLKANLGHTKAAAGIGGFIKATLALHHQIVPPLAAWEKPHPELLNDAPQLQIPTQALAWPAARPLRAGVSSMGFGGINAHVALSGDSETAPRRRALSSREKTLRASAQDAELFVFSAADKAALQAQLTRIQAFAAQLSFSELTDLAAQTARTAGHHKFRAAVTAATPAQFAERLARLLARVEGGEKPLVNPAEGVFYSATARRPIVGLLFPGQASPAYWDGGLWARRWRGVAELYAQAGLKPGRREGDTDAAQPAIVTAELAALRVLQECDVTAQVAVGHSLGELAAYQWAGVWDEATLLRVARARGRAMMDANETDGAMASLAAGAQRAAALLNGEGVVIAGLNSPTQTVLSGSAAGLAKVIEKARAARLAIVKLPVSHAFHSPLVASATPVLAKCLATEEMRPPESAVISTVTGAALAPDADLRGLLLRQITEPVRFAEAVKAAGPVDLWLEAGPGQVLGRLVKEMSDAPVISLDAGGASVAGLLQAVGAAFVLGQDVNHEALAAERFARPFSLDWKPQFFANPCEAAPRLDMPAPVVAQPVAAPAIVEVEQVTAESPLQLLITLVAQRAELPASAVQPHHRLLSDLHLNSITVGQLVAEAAQRLGLPRPLAPTEFADASLEEIVAALAEMETRGEAVAEAEEIPAGVDIWHRPFVVNWRERPLRNVKTQAGAGAWRVFAAPEHPLAEPLREALAQVAGVGVAVCLPPVWDDSQIDLLLQAASEVVASREDMRFVLARHTGNGAASFVRSLHLEAPRVTTCVVEVPLNHPSAAVWIADEARAATRHTEARYDADGRRSEPFWQLLETSEKDADAPLDKTDALLVTGGGKGITAECALALAQAAGARLALLGTSRPEHDKELAANLERIMAAGVVCRYLAADVTDAEAVRAAVLSVESELGPVTALLHGAAVNEPQLLARADASLFRRTLAVKVKGARNLLASVNPEKLRLFVAFGSIIARTGLPGESAYALANEQLTQLTDDWRQQHPHCRCLAAEWSVWGGVGMGARLGLLEGLMRQGIVPITPDTGVAMLRRLLGQPLERTAVIVTGRYREMPTYQIAQTTLPLLRFLEQPRVYFPGVELVADAEISCATDLYLEDHQVGGERLLPGVFGLEAMAQAAQVLCGATERGRFSRVEFLRPVVVPEHEKVTLRVAALRRETGAVDVVLRCSNDGFQGDFFRARYASATEISDETTSLPAPDTAFALRPEKDLYGNILFHRGRFRRLRGYRRLRARSCLAEIAPDGVNAWFSQYLPGELRLGDAGARDAALHAIQACIPHATLLPVSVESIEAGALDAAAPCFAEARELAQEGADYIYDLKVFGADGALREIWRGLRLRTVRGSQPPTTWAAPLLANYATRRLREFWPENGLALALLRDETGERQERSNHAIQLALGHEETIRRRPDGKPETASGRPVSASHCGALTLAAAGAAGCDIETVVARKPEKWKDLLGAARFALAQQMGGSLDEAATRLWSAGECLRKAGALDAPLSLALSEPDGWVIFQSGARAVATYLARMSQPDGRLVCLAAERSADARV